MRKVIEYNSVMARTVEELETEVNKVINIEKPWQPQGSPYVLDGWIYQALVRYEDPDELAKGDQTAMQAVYDRQAEIEKVVDEKKKGLSDGELTDETVGKFYTEAAQEVDSRPLS